MESFDKGGLRIMAEGASLGPALMRMLHMQPESSAAIPPGTTNVPYTVSPTIVLDIEPIVAALDRLTEEVHTLRAELASRSLGGRWSRLIAAIRAWWQGVRHGR